MVGLELMVHLPTVNLVALGEEMIRSAKAADVLEWICVFLYNLIDRIEIRDQFTSSLYEALIDNLDKNSTNTQVAFETISFFWPSAHRLCK